MNLREKILTASFKAEAGHIGSALSCVEIVQDILKKKRKQDVFLFGKASGVATLYCIIHPLKTAVNKLKCYPLPHKKAGALWGLGSVGHALPVAIGMALGNRKRDVYVLLSDGDVQAGTFWESLLFARQHKLKNLKIYIDRNRLQALGHTENILGIDIPLKVARMLFPMSIRETIKGQGVDFMEGKYEWHYKHLDKYGLEDALLQVSD